MHTVNANGANIPALGFGTWDLRDNVATEMVCKALDIGYRHIDTARMYGNESEVGAGIKQSSVKRDDVFLTTKIWPSDFSAGKFREATIDSLKALGVDYVDLLLLHWPNPDVPLAETIGALNQARNDGLTRHIGISNFTQRLVREAVAISEGPIAVNQVEYHPFLNQSTLIDTHAEFGLALTAYCPVARGLIFEDDTLKAIAENHAKSVNQITLRWLLQQTDVAALPRTSRVEHARSNLEIFDFELAEEEMQAIQALGSRNERLVAVSSQGFAPDWDN